MCNQKNNLQMAGVIGVADRIRDCLRQDHYRYLIVGLNERFYTIDDLRIRGFGDWSEFCSAIRTDKTGDILSLPLHRQCAFGVFLHERGALVIRYGPEKAKLKARMLYASSHTELHKEVKSALCNRLQSEANDVRQFRTVCLEELECVHDLMEKSLLPLSLLRSLLVCCANQEARDVILLILCANRFADRNKCMIARLPRDIVLHHILREVVEGRSMSIA
jgi:hypothetical protein